MTVLHSSSFAAVEIRAAGDGRTIVGVAVPFDRPTDVGGYVESFTRGAFARTIAERGAGRVKVLAAHSSSVNPIGRASVLREDPAGLHVELRVSKTQLGDECLALIDDGALDGLSIGFVPIRAVHNPSTGVVERTEVRLDEISLVSFPAYDGARVLAVRAATPQQQSALTELDLIRRRASLVVALSGVHYDNRY